MFWVTDYLHLDIPKSREPNPTMLCLVTEVKVTRENLVDFGVSIDTT